jgi:hypothetical protein
LQASISDVAKELALDWHTVKALEMQYMKAQLARAGAPGPLVIGIDEIAIRKGHTYRIVVSDLLRRLCAALKLRHAFISLSMRPTWNYGLSDRILS